jgi:chorismate mutase/prephenate dehydratase
MDSMKKAFYLGPEGTFSSFAAKNIVDTNTHELVACKNWASLWHEIETTEHSVAVVPVENSISSNVHANIDVLFEAKFTIVAELFLNIRFGLFAKPAAVLTDITAVYSHPQALMQVKQLTKKHGWETYESLSTSNAIQQVADQDGNHLAALAPLSAVNQHNLSCILENAGDSSQNQTRFLLVSSETAVTQSGQKATILIETAHEIGSLSRVLQHFTEQNINMTKIESRPIAGKTWSYQFWIDLQISHIIDIDDLRKAILSSNAVESLTILGIYSPGAEI